MSTNPAPAAQPEPGAEAPVRHLRAVQEAPSAPSEPARVAAGAPTMDPTEWALKAAWASALEQRAAELRKELKAALETLPRLPEGQKGHPVLLPDGSQMGEVRPRAGYSKYSVTDKAEFLEFVSKMHPDQVVLSVNPKFQKELLGLARTDTIPGVGLTEVAPTFTADIPEGSYEEFVDLMAENPEMRAIIDLT